MKFLKETVELDNDVKVLKTKISKLDDFAQKHGYDSTIVFDGVKDTVENHLSKYKDELARDYDSNEFFEESKKFDLDEALGLKEDTNGVYAFGWDEYENPITGEKNWHSVAGTDGINPLDARKKREWGRLAKDWAKKKGYKGFSVGKLTSHDPEEKNAQQYISLTKIEEGISKNMTAEDIAKKHNVSSVDSEKEFTIHYNRNGFEYGSYGAARVKASDEEDAKKKFLSKKTDKDIEITSIRPTENEDIRKGIRLLEENKNSNLEQQIRNTIRNVFKDYDEEDYNDIIGDYLIVDIEPCKDGRTKVEVRAELGYSSMNKIANALDPIVQKLDKDAYFDHDDSGIISAYLSCDKLTETFDTLLNEDDEEYESDDAIIVYEISGQEIERFIESEEFGSYTNEEIVDELVDRFGKDICIKRVSYDEENIPTDYETLYDSGYQWGVSENLKEDSKPQRTLYFTQIADSRFDKDLEETIKRYENEIVSKLSDIDGIKVHTNKVEEVDFGDGTKQLRQDYFIQKNNTKVSWNDIYKIINSVRACRYKFINHRFEENYSLKNLEEEYGQYKDEPYCEEIANDLERGVWVGETSNGTSWELTINGYSSDEFSPSFADYLAEEVAYPVRDGHLAYLGIEMILYKSSMESIFGYDKLDKLIPDLIKLDVDRESIDEWLSNSDPDAILDFHYDFDIAFDEDEWEENNSEDEDLEEDYTHFTYKSGANPYIAKTDKEAQRILNKYKGKVKETKKGFYEIDDIEKNSFIEEDLYHNSYPTIEDMFNSVGVEKVFDEHGYFTPEAEEKYEEVGKKFFDNMDEFDKLCSEEHCFEMIDEKYWPKEVKNLNKEQFIETLVKDYNFSQETAEKLASQLDDKQIYVGIEDHQGGDFGVGRQENELDWVITALEWGDVDEMFAEYTDEDFLDVFKHGDVIDFIQEMWDITIVPKEEVSEEDWEYINNLNRSWYGESLKETLDIERCKDILNNWIDWEPIDNYEEDVDYAIDQLRNLESGGEITEEEYDYIMSNWDELLDTPEINEKLIQGKSDAKIEEKEIKLDDDVIVDNVEKDEVLKEEIDPTKIEQELEKGNDESAFTEDELKLTDDEIIELNNIANI